MISIAMTTYNGEKYLREQLDSILNQDYKDFELIICDDKSKDSTPQILNEYQQKDSRITLYFNESNLGFKKNFEKAISLCKYEYVALSDQDDIWENNHLQKLTEIIDNADIACANARLISENGQSLKWTLANTDGLDFFPQGNVLLYRILCFTGAFQGASMLIKKSFFEKALPIPQDVLFHDAWFSTCAVLSNGLNYSYDIINNYRQHSTQITSHTKTSYVKKFKKFFIRLFKKTEYKTDRFAYINALKERFTLSQDQEKIIEDSYKIQLLKSKKVNFFTRIKYISIYSRNYNLIYTQKSNKYKFSRIIKFLF